MKALAAILLILWGSHVAAKELNGSLDLPKEDWKRVHGFLNRLFSTEFDGVKVTAKWDVATLKRLQARAKSLPEQSARRDSKFGDWASLRRETRQFLESSLVVTEQGVASLEPIPSADQDASRPWLELLLREWVRCWKAGAACIDTGIGLFKASYPEKCADWGSDPARTDLTLAYAQYEIQGTGEMDWSRLTSLTQVRQALGKSCELDGNSGKGLLTPADSESARVWVRKAWERTAALIDKPVE